MRFRLRGALALLLAASACGSSDSQAGRDEPSPSSAATSSSVDTEAPSAEMPVGPVYRGVRLAVEGQLVEGEIEQVRLVRVSAEGLIAEAAGCTITAGGAGDDLFSEAGEDGVPCSPSDADLFDNVAELMASKPTAEVSGTSLRLRSGDLELALETDDVDGNQPPLDLGVDYGLTGLDVPDGSSLVVATFFTGHMTVGGCSVSLSLGDGGYFDSSDRSVVNSYRPEECELPGGITALLDAQPSIAQVDDELRLMSDESFLVLDPLL